ncbi:MAG TPA: GIY-YIG nuclease family protein [Paludibaculum sp.]|jgi:hypothetical protein
MEAKADRRKAIQDYKSRKTPRGIFCARVGTSGPAWVGSSPNLDAAQNGLWFQLRLGSHRNRPLQEEWNRWGEAAFSFEILEQLDDDICALGVNDLLKERRVHWLARLNAQPV